MVQQAKLEMVNCPRWDGDGEEPGAPLELDGSVALCGLCSGAGEISLQQAREYYEEDV